ncbi:MAG: PAS domain S-box protein [Magnetococcales bacterium]|nr:PAS domain S-box protein [Magnetococcales bacterium]
MQGSVLLSTKQGTLVMSDKPETIPRTHGSRPSLPLSSFRLRLVAVYCIVSLLFAGVVTLWLRESRLAQENLAVAATRNLAQALGHGLELTFESIDHALLAVADEVAHQLTHGPLDDDTLNLFLDRQEKRLGGYPLVLGDAQGQLTHGDMVRKYGTVSIADRDYFLQARSNPQAGFLISKPFKGRLSGMAQIAVARRVNDSEGNFFGVVFSTVQLDQFAERFDKLDLGRHGLVTLRNQDSVIIARFPPLSAQQGQPGSVSISPELTAIRSAGRQEATYMAISPTDGVKRIYTYRIVQGTGMYLIVGTALDDVLEKWHRDLKYVSGLGLLMMGLLGVAMARMFHARRKEETILAQLTAGNVALHREMESRRHVEEFLRKSEERYRLMSENMIDLICLHSQDARFIYVAPSVTAMLGYEPEELLGRHPKEFYHPDDADRLFNPSYQKVAVDKQNDNLICRALTKNGHYIWLEILVRPVLNADGQIVHIQSVARDVSDRVGAENALRGERDFIHEMINALPGIFYLISSQGRFRLWNKKIEDVSGFSSEEMAVISPADLFRGGERDYITERIKEVFTHGFATAEASIVSKNGTVTPHSFVGQRIDRDGVPFLIGMGLDISAHKRLEGDLRQAKDAAENANLVKSDFLATMSHEIRTPMNVVIGMGDVLLESELGEEQRGYVKKLQEAGSNLLELINQILDFSKIDAGHLQIEEEPVNVAKLLREVTELFRVVSVGKGLSLVCETDGSLPDWVTGDKLRLRQILFNLLSNAIKFTESGHVVLRGRVDPKISDQMCLTVEDTGIGVAHGQMDVIFNPFTQGDSSITRRHGGTGLGLTISRRLVELMGGRIWLESRPGSGSTFHVTLPLRLAKPPPAPVEADTPGTDMHDPSLHILVVEDAEDNQLLIRTFLKNTPHFLEIVENGEEAVRRVREKSFDLVFMDVQMPVMDGYTATRLIRQWEQKTRQRPLCIIALTAHALHGESERSREAGCDLYLNKPIKKQRLLEVIRQMGARNRQHSAECSSK